MTLVLAEMPAGESHIKTPGAKVITIPAIKYQHQNYTCPMHPQIMQDGPGNCPLCGMTLVPLIKSKDGGAHASHSSGIADSFFCHLL